MQRRVVARGLGLTDHDEPAVGCVQHLDRCLVEPRQRLGGEHLLRGARHRAAPAEIHDPIEIGQDRVHVVGDDQDRDALRSGRSRETSAATPAWFGRSRLSSGSSSSNKGGRRASACAISSRCCSPPEHCPIGRSRVLVARRRARSARRPVPVRAGSARRGAGCRSDRRRARGARCRCRGCAPTGRSCAAAGGSRCRGWRRRAAVR